MWEEYKALEARMHNDSRVIYGLVAAQLALAFGFLSAFFAYLDRIEDASAIEVGQVLTALVLGASSILVMIITSFIQRRVNDTGNIRRARAVQLEFALGIHSFRLFPPWKDLPPGYLHRLGEISRNEAWNGNPETYNQYCNAGDREYTNVCRRLTISTMLSYLFWGFIAAFAILVIAFFALHK
jgi:hypothetical protein